MREDAVIQVDKLQLDAMSRRDEIALKILQSLLTRSSISDVVVDQAFMYADEFIEKSESK